LGKLATHWKKQPRRNAGRLIAAANEIQQQVRAALASRFLAGPLRIAQLAVN